MDRNDWREARAIAVGGIAVILVLLLILLAIQLRETLAVLALGIVLGIALNPFVDKLQNFHIPRVASLLLVYAVVALLVAGFVYLAWQEVRAEDFNVQVDELRETYEDFREGTALPPVEEVEEALRDIGSSALGGVVDQAFSLISGIFYFFTVLFSALLFSITQNRMRGVFLAFFPPSQRTRTEEVLDVLGMRLRRFVIGELTAMLLIGATTYAGLVILGIKLPLLLAFIAFLFELIPMVGPWISYFPALGVALTQGWVEAVEVSILYLGIQSFENYFVTPVVHSRESRLPAYMVFSALLIGGALMGVLGALISLPVAVVIHTLFFEVLVPWNERRTSEPQLRPLRPAAQRAPPLATAEPRGDRGA